MLDKFRDTGVSHLIMSVTFNFRQALNCSKFWGKQKVNLGRGFSMCMIYAKEKIFVKEETLWINNLMQTLIMKSKLKKR